jgi:hypothetical protein
MTPIAGSLTCEDERDEDAMPEDVLVTTRLVVCLAMPWGRQELEHGDEDEERHRVQQKEERERARFVCPRDRARDESAEREADVHRHALLRKRRVTPLWRRQRAEEGRLARPERSTADADQQIERKRVPGLSDQREEDEGDRAESECRAEDHSWPEPVGQRTRDKAGEERGGRAGGNDEPCHPEREPAHVVQVDDQERPDHAVPEHVREPARLEDPDVPRQLRVQAPEVVPHVREPNDVKVASRPARCA